MKLTPKRHIGFFLLLAVLLAGLAVVSLPRPAAAQCGSSASSCKNCHEVQKQDPVSTKGAWHAQHAFGDFCEFCHAGNVKAKDKTAAHAGMIDPLADVKGSCQSCHPNDYMDRAKTYADALGKTIGTMTMPAASAPVTSTTATTSTLPCGPAAPTGGQVIDLNKLYAGADSATPLNIGNIVLVGLIGAVVLLLVGLVFHYEHPIERGVLAFRRLLAMPARAAVTPEGVMLDLPASAAHRPDLDALLAQLASSDPAAVRAISQLLSDREHGPRVLKALSHMDLNALTELGESDQKALAALLALAKELKN